MVDFDVEALLSPLSGATPCGADLEYDPAFLALEEAARGKPEQEYGATLIPAQEPEWRAVDEQAALLFTRTKDLRVLMHWLRARTHLGGLRGFASTLPLVLGLLERYWEQVFPALDADDGNDPTMRLNALAPLADPTSVLADLRGAALGSARVGLRVRDVEIAAGRLQPNDGEVVASAAGVLQAFSAAEAESPGLLQAVREAHATLQKIDALIMQRAGPAGPDLKPLQRITHGLADSAARVDAAGATDAVPAAAAAGIDAPPAAPGSLRSREDAIHLLERACDWIERNEPSHPAPLLIRRAQRLMAKNFMEIIRDLVPEGIDQVTRIAGVTED